MKKSRSGFTIVELLIVIVVIGILAAITIVAYNGIQQRARDTARKSDLALIAKSLKLYYVDNGDYAVSGCGSSGNGWLDYSYSGVSSIAACLKRDNHLSKDITDPINTNINSCSIGNENCYHYLKYTCAMGTFLYANLETLPHSTTATDNTCYVTADSERGINYFVKVD